jgi:hypothetical protein
MAGRAFLAAAVVATALSGCGAGADSPSSRARSAATGPLASCDRPSPIGDAPGIGGPEVVGHGVAARLWGLIQARRYPLVAGRDVVKVVWRMTGRGPLHLAAYDGRGQRIPLAWGPEPHGGSNYRRPGDEWGAGYRFRRAGCYRLTAQRTTGSAVVWLHMAPSTR